MRTLLKIFNKELKTEPDIIGHGGKRIGAGRPKKEPTKVMRIPLSKVDKVTRLIKK